MKDPFLNCPECGSKSQIAIIYGYPSTALIQEARVGNIKLGGCVIRNTSNAFICDNCGEEYGPLNEVWGFDALKDRIEKEKIPQNQLQNYIFELILMPDVSIDERMVALRFIQNFNKLLELRLVADERLQPKIKEYMRQIKSSG